NKSYLYARSTETLGLLYADHFPFRQMATARGVRRSPLHEHLKARGAVFGEVAGWERANWFATDGQERQYRYSWKRQNWFDNQRAEHMAVRTGVGLFDMTSFGKIRVEGRDACAFLNHLCANEMDVEPGRIVYTQMLNGRGGIESDLTVTRLSETAFMLVVPGATLQRDLAWLRRHVGDRFAVITDVTASESVLCLMGPKARDVLAGCSPNDFSNTVHPFGTMREVEIGMGIARAHRVTYVGELGWEIYVSTDMAAHVFEALEDAGSAHGLKLCGLHTLDSCRIEKAFRHFGHDISDEDHVLEAGLGFAVKTAKGDFLGRDAVLRKRDSGLERRIMQFRLKDPEPLLYHHEPLVRDGRIVSYVTSGNYGHFLGGAIGMGYAPCKGESTGDLLASSWEIEIAGERFAAEASLAPLYDPKAERVRM
ncbi:MAG TPA: glycine cleavage T C-terminal barrel domain-containing protein, partial [Rhizobiaceae bacterium]|nr:glycine cleavage T C-terminal barrel domain-containing protein [Rhizobiaceae bacterium]